MSEITEVQILADGGAIDSWEGLYPDTSFTIGPYTTIHLMTQLSATTRDTVVYRLLDIH